MNQKIENKVAKVIKYITFKAAEVDANTACPFITYQPQLPEKVKKMRKF